MNLFLKIFFLSLLISLMSGLYINSTGNFLLGNKVIGFTVLTSAFVFMPIFLVHRWKGKNLIDYTLSKENLEKLRDLEQKK